MSEAIKNAADTVLKYTTERFGGVPGVVAMATDRKANFYEGAAGKRELGKDQPMTTDSVFAIFSTTKPLTGTLAMQLVEGRPLSEVPRQERRRRRARRGGRVGGVGRGGRGRHARARGEIVRALSRPRAAAG